MVSKRFAPLVILVLAIIVGIIGYSIVKKATPGPVLDVVVSPIEGQIVMAGGTVHLIIAPPSGLQVTDAEVWSPIGTYSQRDGAPITLLVPNDKLGPVQLSIGARLSDGSVYNVDRTIQVSTDQTLKEIVTDPKIVSLVAPGTSDAEPTERSLNIYGVYADGVQRDVSGYPQAVIKLDSPTVATIGSTGLVSAVAPGSGVVTVTIGRITGSARVEVNIFELKGDLDGDNDVDQGDLNIVQKALNMPASGAGDPRDLNNDMKIDTADAQALTELCSRPNCATN